VLKSCILSKEKTDYVNKSDLTM